MAHTISCVEVAIDAKLVRCDACGNQFNSPELEQDIAAMALDAYRGKAGLLKPDRTASSAPPSTHARGTGAPSRLGHHDAEPLRKRRDPGRGARSRAAHDHAAGHAAGRVTERPDALAPERREQVLGSHCAAGRTGSRRTRNSSAHTWAMMDRTSGAATGRLRRERFKAMVLHFCKDPGVPRTKLNKLLWLADFHAFCEDTTSISGCGTRTCRMGRRPTATTRCSPG